ncbi:MAG: hypothetical protein PUP90_16025 [Nostoc sp. S4]|nr:hypothetical protein [Nostoc sp. S4]
MLEEEKAFLDWGRSRLQEKDNQACYQIAEHVEAISAVFSQITTSLK